MAKANNINIDVLDDIIIGRVEPQIYAFTTETIPCMFVPNTYEVYWDVSLDSFLKRMKDEYSKFWTD